MLQRDLSCTFGPIDHVPLSPGQNGHNLGINDQGQTCPQCNEAWIGMPNETTELQGKGTTMLAAQEPTGIIRRYFFLGGHARCGLLAFGC